MMSDFRYILFILIPQVLWCQCSPAAVHSHSIHQERVEDGGYRPRDANHIKDGEHYSEFDHEAIIGSVKDAEEYDKLPIEESKRRLGLLLLKMDINGDEFITRDELKSWILRSFMKLSEEEAKEKFEEVDADQNDLVTWKEYISETYGLESEYRIPEDESDSEESMISEDKVMFNAVDENKDGVLNFKEFVMFFNPEDYPKMHPIIIEQTLKEKDLDYDGKISFQEFLGDKGYDHDKEWVATEKDKFDQEYDLNLDGFLTGKEIQAWMIPNNEWAQLQWLEFNSIGKTPSGPPQREKQLQKLHEERMGFYWTETANVDQGSALKRWFPYPNRTRRRTNIADDEVEHLFVSSDDDHDLKLSFDEIIDHHDVFVGSEATDYGDHLLGSHFDDEL